MAQITKGFRRILSNPTVYDGFQNLLGAKRSRIEYINSYLRPLPEAKILDIGCGAGEILCLLPESVRYVGFDLSAAYIAAAKKRYGSRGEWHCAAISEMDIGENGTFDLVMANGVFHHLDEAEALRLSEMAARALKPTGRFCTLDGCYVARQHPVARYLISKDRGQNVRDPDGYQSLVHPYFRRVELHLRDDLLRVPYTHAIMVVTEPRGA